MNIIKALLFLTFLIIICPTVKSQNWNLVWQDEFNNSISSDWVFETGNGSSGWGNNELQYYRRENATVENGKLVITAKKENFGGHNYTSARMKTQGRKKFKYGKIEARIALPSGQGLWPAFWMLGSNITSVGWPACGEIDIMEHVNNAPDIHGTIHWKDHNNNYASYGGHTAANVTNYHVYSVEWNEKSITWFIDGNQYHITDISNGVNGTSEFHDNYFLLLNLAVGGNWPGFSVNNSKLPARMYVDYVRVYQSGGVNPNPTTGDVTLYLDCPHKGFSVGLSEGSYTKAQLEALGMPNDKVSSLRVKSGYKATLYWDDNFKGASLVKTSDDSCLNNDGSWNDKMTSIIVSKTNDGGSSQAIEAENYTNMSGVQKENCSEGGQNVGYIDTGDWMAYTNINFPTSGNYRIEYRVASLSEGGKLSADLNAGTTVLGALNIPSTGGWQNWTTISHTVNVNAGTHSFGIYAVSGGWNINWIKITKRSNAKIALDTKTDTGEDLNSKITIYPNPITDELNIKGIVSTSEISIVNISGQLEKNLLLEKGDNSLKFDVRSLKPGTYFVRIHNGIALKVFRFMKK
ncbi:putative secreted protein (Por secretion system target) [Aquimarina sp. MAR_2010_214]|uniref:carbohydrate-binding protein n=1 Tax=Aquimarina sp. MAR_2010_214 TaxID=1250026 RepID=UPI000C6FD6A8|nr:carbohydrate-binding protein [Aquimarina sp. MAR_2010_214]PKV50189.1 putative secreted protein (Por secretion system target) [Aquimarina sp. MAR_2010_214]